GYHAALREPEPEALAARLGAVRAEDVGFAYEGAAMALWLLDRLVPGRGGRTVRFLDGPAAPHAYLGHGGVGWAGGRGGRPPGRLGDARPPAAVARARRLRVPRGVLPPAAVPRGRVRPAARRVCREGVRPGHRAQPLVRLRGGPGRDPSGGGRV